jgi:hypothetical protein
MIKLRQILNELAFDLSTAFPFKYIGGKYNEYTFETDQNSYKVAFKPDGESTYERVYHTTNRGLGNNFEDTQEGKPIPINATVMKITLDFIERTPNFSMIYIVPISRSRFNIVKRFIENNLPKKYPFVAEASDNGEDIIAIYRDEQTKNLLSEIKINKPGIPEFKNNDKLAQYLKKNPFRKKELIDAIWNSSDWRGGDEESWDYVLQGWYNNDIEQYGEYNIDDEIMVDSGEGDSANISTHPISPEKFGITTNEYRVKFGPNELYWYFY